MWNIVERLLKERGMKASDISKATGIGASTLSECKSGRYTPKSSTLQKVADFFGVSVDYIVTGKEREDSVYYLSTETAKIAQEILMDSNKRILFDAAQDATPDDLKFAADLLIRLKGTNKDA